MEIAPTMFYYFRRKYLDLRYVEVKLLKNLKVKLSDRVSDSGCFNNQHNHGTVRSL